MLALRYGFQKLEREAPSTNRMCSKFKEANDFLKWQESSWRKNENSKNHELKK